MIKTIVDVPSHKIIKNVTAIEDAVRYMAFGFFWLPMQAPIRVIYNNVTPNFTVWTLDKTTGIWGCFADQNDLGFDYFAEHAKLFDTLTALKQKDPDVLEKLEDALCAKFFELARKHTDDVYNMHIKLDPSIQNSFFRPKSGKSDVVAIVDAAIEP